MAKYFCLVALACLILVLGACSSVRILPPSIPTGEVNLENRGPIIDRLIEQAAGIESFRGLLHARVVHGDDQYQLRYIVVFKAPDRLRIEVLPAGVGYTTALIVSKDGSTQLISPRERQVEIAKADGSLVRSMLDLPLTEQELAALLIGVIPEFIGSSASSAGFRVYRDAESVVVSAAPFRYFVLAPDSFSLQRAYLRKSGRGNPDLDIEFGDFAKIDGIELPQSLVINTPRHEVTTYLTVTKAAVNRDISDELFQVSIPPGYQTKSR